MIYRLVGYILILVSILFLPYWVYLPVLFTGIIFFRFFWEGIVLAFLIDAVHNVLPATLITPVSPLTFAVLAALIIMLPVKENMRSYV
ncbi:MAG: hypothetical protein HYX23_00290 [Candidatus Zambryskibacteria bacterium]|nr:hypothetical protein [Candidatus Zambryskibacteria bacterium]